MKIKRIKIGTNKRKIDERERKANVKAMQTRLLILSIDETRRHYSWKCAFAFAFNELNSMPCAQIKLTNVRILEIAYRFCAYEFQMSNFDLCNSHASITFSLQSSGNVTKRAKQWSEKRKIFRILWWTLFLEAKIIGKSSWDVSHCALLCSDLVFCVFTSIKITTNMQLHQWNEQEKNERNFSFISCLSLASFVSASQNEFNYDVEGNNWTILSCSLFSVTS